MMAFHTPSISSLPTLSLQSNIKKAGKRKRSTSSSDSNNNGLSVGKKVLSGKSVTGSSIPKECGQGLLTETSQILVGQLSQTVSKKKGKKRKLVDIDSVDGCEDGRGLVEGYNKNQ